MVLLGPVSCCCWRGAWAPLSCCARCSLFGAVALDLEWEGHGRGSLAMTLYLYILIAHWLALLAATKEPAGAREGTGSG